MINDSPQILVAVDGSTPSNWAVDVGADLAGRLGGSVTLVHVVIPPTIGAGEGALLIADIDDGLRAEGEALLAAAARRLPPGLLAGTVLREGAPGLEIVDVAAATRADFIVTGSRGRGRWAHFILGSTAEEVIRRAPCPVVTVRMGGKLEHEHRPAGAAAGA